jgi:uncharacterized protein YjbI with pentapeptide repeats
VLRRLDGALAVAILRFLTEAGLINKGRPVIGSLVGAHLRDAKLQGSVLRNTALQGVDFSGADMRGADLRDADLGMSEETKKAANLRGADLTRANLTDADLSGADLSGATAITNEELEQQAASLKGATMPNGQKYEDWLKDKKAQGKDEKNE